MKFYNKNRIIACRKTKCHICNAWKNNRIANKPSIPLMKISCKPFLKAKFRNQGSISYSVVFEKKVLLDLSKTSSAKLSFIGWIVGYFPTYFETFFFPAKYSPGLPTSLNFLFRGQLVCLHVIVSRYTLCIVLQKIGFVC
ncbi:unnamed protein product [Clavelina lepadiformis]|uniref:Uncharacterized protein n=1 Tax=Clavelina lepadiformis TaxID=159417 RepID=A0ABP0EZ20_CLALP